MPTASDRDRDWAIKTFGSISDDRVVKELEARHFTLTKEWLWKRTKSPTKFEWRCINFLIDEWDFGGYVED